MDTGDDTLNGQPILTIPSAAAWEEWLSAHRDGEGAWLKQAKKGSGLTTISHVEALDVALCHGWIDAQRRSLDDRFYLQRFCPRTRRSTWSKVNREKVAALTAAGRMRAGGVAAVEAAQADGRWDAAYDPPSRAMVPPDLQKALDASPAATEFWARLDKSNRYAVLHRIQGAKRPDTRARRITQFVEMLARGEKIHP